MKRKIKEPGEPRKNEALRKETRIPLDWKLLAAAEAFKPW